MSGLIELALCLPATLYPTITVAVSDWEKAKEKASGGEQAELDGVLGGHACRGEPFSGRAAVTITGPSKAEHGVTFWPGVMGDGCPMEGGECQVCVADELHR